MSEGLTEYSQFYRNEVSFYDRFAKAEDAPGRIEHCLLELVENKRVADIGCGTGK